MIPAALLPTKDTFLMAVSRTIRGIMIDTPSAVASPPLPQHPPESTPIPAASAPVELTHDRYLIGRVLVGLKAVATDPRDAENRCPGPALRGGVHSGAPDHEMHPSEEVVRILAAADPGNPGADAWHVVTVTRPSGSTEPVWKPHAAAGPMTLDAAHEFLAGLGVQAVSLAQHSNVPIPDDLSRGGDAVPRTPSPDVARFFTRNCDAESERRS